MSAENPRSRRPSGEENPRSRRPSGEENPRSRRPSSENPRSRRPSSENPRSPPRSRRPSGETLAARPSAPPRSLSRASTLLGFNRAEKVQLLAERSPLGAYLSPDELTQLAKMCSITRFKKGKPIQADSPFYLVVDGVVAVMDDDAVTELTSRRAGSFFTRMAGRGAVKGRKAKSIDTALMGKTSGYLLLGPTDEESLDNFYLRLSSEAREGYDAIISTNISTVLSSVNFINEANPTQAMLRNLGELCSYMPLHAGDMVFEQGDDAEAFYIVLKGSVEAITDSSEAITDSQEVEAKSGGLTRVVGETFGVAALVLGASLRTYGMRAKDLSLFIRIGFDDFRPFLNNHPELEKSLWFSTKLFLVQRYSALPSSIFHSFNQDELKTAARVASIKHVAPGEVVYAVGDDPEAFYVVAHGEVQREYGEHSGVRAPTRILYSGTYFGEVGMLLPETKCFATITGCAEGATLLAISKADFGSVCNPEMTRKSSNTWRMLRTSPGEPRRESFKPPGSGRSLHHALLVELLIKLRRSEVRLHVLLQHPRTHRDFVDFALEEMRGVLRAEVYNHACTMLQRVRAALSAVDHVSAETEMHMRKYLDEQAKGFFVEQLRRNPCPHVRGGDEQEAAERLADREYHFVQHVVQHPATLDELDALFAQLCDNYTEILQIAYTRYIHSVCFEETLDEMGAYAEGVAGLVGVDAVASLARSFDRMAGDKGGSEYNFVPLEVARASRTRRPSNVESGGLSPEGSFTSGSPTSQRKRRTSRSPRKSSFGRLELSKDTFTTG